LTAEQESYAAMDVEVLVDLYEAFAGRVIGKS
jgi:ribonuclease D